MTIKQGELLSKINSVADLRKLDPGQLPQLCDEIRQFIVDVVCINPGHLGASLGTVEMAVAIHYVFDTPSDKLIWDVGHQAYAHKILTGRKDQFHTYRTFKGLSGFPRMEESEYDSFGTGHSSTSISAALGMAVGSAIKHEHERKHIAVIGDGSMTAGLAFEGLNNAGTTNADILVILNDNGIAIDNNVGALKDYLISITTSQFYNRLKGKMWQVIPWRKIRRFINKILVSTKLAIVKQSNLFEALNFRYFGPVDGHDVVKLVKLLNGLKKIKGPKLLHCITVKGKGFDPAEKEQTRYHAPGVFDKYTGDIIEPNGNGKFPKYQVVFGETITELAAMNPRICGITPAMLTGCSLNIMMAKYPERVFDVGIAEQHAVTFSAGLATQGIVPFCNIYSSFLQRSYDQIIHDVAIQKLPVIFCIDRGGLVGEDGATHHGSFDLAFLNTIPNMIISAPMNEEELRNLMFTAQQANHGPFSIRYPKGTGVTEDWRQEFKTLEIGKGRRLRDGNDLAIISIGHPGNYAAEAITEAEKSGLSIAHYDMRFLKPVDEGLLHEVFARHKKVITIEDGTIIGGLGSAVLSFMADNNYSAKVLRLGIPDKFIEHGSNSILHRESGYDAKGILRSIRSIMKG